MYFKTLQLTNFKRIGNATFDFSKVNILSGQNYSGKSSVISALIYVFANYLEEKIQHYIKWDSPHFLINSLIIDNKNTYEYNIKYSKSNEKTLIINNTDRFSNSEASKKFAQIVDPNLAFYSSVSMQGQSTNVIFDSPAERANVLKKILGLDKLLDVSDLMKADISSQQMSLEKVSSQISILDNLTYIYMQIPEIEPIDDIISQFEILESQKNIYERSLRKYQLYLDQVVQYNKVKEQIVNLTYQIDTIENEIVVLKTKFLPSLDYDNNRLLEISNLINSLNKEKHTYELQLSNISRLEEKKNYIISQIASKTDKMSNLSVSRIKMPEYNEEQLSSTIGLLKENQAELKILLKNKTLFATGKCPTCDQPYHGDMNKLEEDILNRNNEIKRLEEQIGNMQTSLTSYSQALKNREFILSQKESLMKEITLLQEDVITAQQQIDILNKNLTFNESSHSLQIIQLNTESEKLIAQQMEAKRVKDYNDSINNNILKLSNMLTVNTNTIESLKKQQEPSPISEPIMYDSELYESLKRKISIHETNVINREKAITHNQIIQAKEKDDKDTLAKLIEQKEDFYRSIQIVLNSKSILDKDLSPYLLESGVVDIVNIMNNLFTKIHSQYEVSLKQEKKNLEFFYTTGDGINRPILMASGFERQIISLSFKLALTVLSGLGILFLDETDSDADESNSIVFYNTLLESNVLDQVFIVSHKPETVRHLINNFNARCFYMDNGNIVGVEN